MFKAFVRSVICQWQQIFIKDNLQLVISTVKGSDCELVKDILEISRHCLPVKCTVCIADESINDELLFIRKKEYGTR